MSYCPERAGRASRSRLPGLCFGLLLLLLAGARPGNAFAQGQNQTSANPPNLQVELKVCVANEKGEAVNVQPLLLNSANKRDVIKINEGKGCFASPSIKLTQGQIYFLAAISEDRSQTAFKQFTVPLDEKETPLKLTLTKQDARSNTLIEICAKDEQGNLLPVTGVEAQGGGGLLTKEEVQGSLCYRGSANASNEYRLSLTAKSGAVAGGFSQKTVWLLGVPLAMIALATLALTSLLFYRFKQLEPKQAGEESMPGRHGQAGESAGDTLDNEDGVEARQTPTPPPPSQSNQQSDDQPGAPDEPEAQESATVADEHHTAGQPTDSPSNATTRSQHLHHVEDIKAKYLRFSRGDEIEHFYLTPSGASSASEMVEDAKVELLEQNKGSYVAFRSGDNEAEAWVFPMPKMHFTAETFRAVFPHLTETEYEAGNIEPKRAVSPQPKSWKIQ
ncbi:MAG TPA: hypothetical protein VGO96_05865 [Pyrinomonadaceae bacterium]|jgi:hypothetical protein|nr:hypothetical protein [Pyrinomonadaceae bacterium]